MLQNMMGMVLNRLRQLPEVPVRQMVHTEVAGKQTIPTAEVHVKHKI